jgi:hypothetical protein
MRTAYYPRRKVPVGRAEDAHRDAPLIEHRLAILLRDKIQAEGGVALAAEWIHPAELAAIGLTAAEKDAASTRA